MVDVRSVQALYERHQYLDAYALTRDAWADRSTLDQLDARGIVLAARLASRLGGEKWSAALLREAKRRFPDSLEVRVYVDGRVARGRHFLDVIALHARHEDLGGDDTELRAAWRAAAAQYWVMCRDFERAHASADAAIALGGHGWAETTKAYVLFAEDRWAEALAGADAAWDRQPGSAFTAHVWTAALGRLGRGDEACQRLVLAADAHQTADIASMAVWSTLGRAERLERGGPRHAELIAEAARLTRRVEALSPLADREQRQSIAALRADAADVAGDRDAMRTHGTRSGRRYYRTVAENVARNPGGARRVLPHIPVFQRHQTCLPASFVTCTSSFDLDFDHDVVAHAMTHGGTLTWRLRAYCAEHGLVARSFIADATAARALVGAGIPFILMFRGEEVGHAVAVIGVDEAQGTLLVHDPSHERWSRVLIDKLGAGEAPLGPAALVVLPKARASELDALPLSGVAGEEARSAYTERRAGAGRAERTEIVTALEARSPTHAVTQQLRAWDASARGASDHALSLHQALVEAHPDCREARAGLLSAIQQVGSSTLLLDALRGVVDEGAIPGHAAGQDWIRPHPRHLAQLADVLRASSERHAEAERVLRRAIRQFPGHGLSFQVLGELWWSQGRTEDAELAFRMAATSNIEDEGIARTYADVLHDRGKTADALVWLRGRAKTLDHARIAYGPRMTLARALRDYGFPGECKAILDAALEGRADDGALIAEVLRLRLAAGQLAEAKALLPRLEACATRAEQLTTWAAVARHSGDGAALLSWCRQWVEEEPELGAHRALLSALAEYESADAALEMARTLAAQHPDNDDYDALVLTHLSMIGRDAERAERLRARVARSPHDGWAWRELCITTLDEVQRKPADQRREALAELTPVFESARRTSRGTPTLDVLEAQRSLLAQEDPSRALDALERALERDPTFAPALAILVEEVSKHAPLHARMLAAVDAAIARTPGSKVQATTVALGVARALSLDEATARVASWRQRWPDDLALTVAHGELALIEERGRSAAIALIAELEPVLARYPDSNELRQVLARAYERADQTTALVEQLREVLRRAPMNVGARRMLARALSAEGAEEDALDALREAVRLAPMDATTWLSLAGRLLALERYAESERVLSDAIDRHPEIMDLRELRLALFAEQDLGERAIAETRSLIARFPDGAYVHLMHARTLLAHVERSTRAEIEASLERTLALNAQLDEGVDEYAVHLARLGDHEAATALLDRFIPSVAAPEILQGRRAWLQWERGQCDAALSAMADTIERHPAYPWGWERLLDWLDERPSPALAARLLPVFDRVPIAGAALGLARVRLMTHAAVTSSAVETAWRALVSEYPRSAPVVLTRFDALWKERRYADARALIEPFVARQRTDAFARARLVQALTTLGQEAHAIEVAVDVWTAPGDGGWPEAASWDLLESADLLEPAIEVLFDRLAAGDRPRRSVVDRLVIHLDAHDRPGLDRLMRWAEADPRLDWVQARILHAHLDAGRTREVQLWHDAHSAACASRTPLWLAAGRWVSLTRSASAARAWWSTVFERGQVGFYAVLLYLEALESVGERRQIAEEARRALATLLPDADRPRVLALVFRTMVQLDDDIDFLASWARWSRVPGIPDAEVFACFAEVHQATAESALKLLRARLAAAIASSEDPPSLEWARPALKRRLQAKRTGWSRVAGWFT